MGIASGGSRMLEIMRNHFAPENADWIYKEEARAVQFRRTDQTIDEYFAEYDPLRRRAESEM